MTATLTSACADEDHKASKQIQAHSGGFVMALMICLSTLLTSQVMADEYLVRIRSDDLRLAHVEATLDHLDGGLAMKDNKLVIKGVEASWADYVSNIHLADGAGVQLTLTKSGRGRWSVRDYRGGSVKLSYDVRLEFDKLKLWMGSDGAAYVADSGVMWSGRALFIAGLPTDAVAVTFDLPSGWHVSTPWLQLDRQARRFKPSSTTDLLDSAFMAGTHGTFATRAGNVNLNVALSGEHTLALRHEYERWLKQYLEYYAQRYGTIADTQALLISSDLDSDGFIHMGGEVMGHAIVMTTSTGAFWLNNIGVVNLTAHTGHTLSHELFHFFAAGTALTDEPEGIAEWFNEGFSAEYASWTTMLRLGVIDEDHYLKEVSRQWYRYLDAADGVMTLAKAGADKSGNAAMVYSGGFVAALALDFLIREQSNGSQSIDDLWAQLIAQHPHARHHQLTYGELLTTVESMFGSKVRQALDAYVNNPRTIPLAEMAKPLGLEFRNRWPYIPDARPPLKKREDMSDRQHKLWQEFTIR